MAKQGPTTPFGEALKKALDGRKVPWLEGTTGISRGRLHRLITGRGEVTLAEAAAIAAALNVPVETFLAPAEEEEAGHERPGPGPASPLPFAFVPPHAEEATPVSRAASLR